MQWSGGGRGLLRRSAVRQRAGRGEPGSGIALNAVSYTHLVLRTDAIPASVSAGAALHAAAQLLANCNSRAALAIFSGRASIV